MMIMKYVVIIKIHIISKIKIKITFTWKTTMSIQILRLRSSWTLLITQSKWSKFLQFSFFFEVFSLICSITSYFNEVNSQNALHDSHKISSISKARDFITGEDTCHPPKKTTTSYYMLTWPTHIHTSQILNLFKSAKLLTTYIKTQRPCFLGRTRLDWTRLD